MIAPPFASQKYWSINQKLKERIIITERQKISFIVISPFDKGAFLFVFIYL